MDFNQYDPQNPIPQEDTPSLPEEPTPTPLPEEPQPVAEEFPLPEEPQPIAEEFPMTEELPLPEEPALSARPEEYQPLTGEELWQQMAGETPPVSQEEPPAPAPVGLYSFDSTGYYHPTPEVQKPKSKLGLRIFAGVLAAVILLICSLSAGYLAGRRSAGMEGNDLLPWNDASSDAPQAGEETPGNTSSFDITTDSPKGEGYDYQQIVSRVSPSIVNITVYSSDGQNGSYASGIIMNAKEGYVLTNDHIYSEIPNAKFLITLNNGTEFKADFVSGDSRSDIGILKIQNPKGLTAATFSTDPLNVGERVLAIGQSYGYADTVSEGIVSAVDRRVSLSSGSYSEKYIQTTAAINPGNSGGALVNMYGQVVGVTSAKIASNEVEGLGFAIPSEKALAIVKNLQANGKVVGRAKLGITYTEVGTVTAEVNGTPTGLYIQEISEDSDLYNRGFTTGDIITKVNGKEITISTVVLDIIEEAKAGDTLSLEIYKAASKTRETVTVKLAEAESTSGYSTKQPAASTPEESAGNDLPENPFEYYFGENFGQ